MSIVRNLRSLVLAQELVCLPNTAEEMCTLTRWTFNVGPSIRAECEARFFLVSQKLLRELDLSE